MSDVSGSSDHHVPAADESLKPSSSKLDDTKAIKNGSMDNAEGLEGANGLTMTNSQSNMALMFSIINEDEIIHRRLLIDGDGCGDDRKLAKLVELYLNIVEEEQEKFAVQELYEKMKSFLKQCDLLRSLSNKSYHSIETNLKAIKYHQIVMYSLEKEMCEHKSLVKSQRQKAQEIKLKQQQNAEILATLEFLKGQEERSTIETSIKMLTEEVASLTERDKVLNGMIDHQKQYLDLLCDLAKRLLDDNPEIVEKAVVQTEEQVLSDVSMELD